MPTVSKFVTWTEPPAPRLGGRANEGIVVRFCKELDANPGEWAKLNHVFSYHPNQFSKVRHQYEIAIRKVEGTCSYEVYGRAPKPAPVKRTRKSTK